MGGSKPSDGVRRTTARAAWRPAAAAAALALMLGPMALRAQELRVATAVDITSIDPQFANLDANSAMAMHIFSRLVERDARLRLRPGLAESWRLVDETTWEFRLRRGVTFHDGSPLTAEDVKASIERTAAVPNSPSPLAVYVRPITAVEVVDPWTVRLRTAQLFTQMPMFMSTIAIMSRRALEAVARPEHRGGSCSPPPSSSTPGKERSAAAHSASSNGGAARRRCWSGSPVTTARRRPGAASRSGRSPTTRRGPRRCSPATRT